MSQPSVPPRFSVKSARAGGWLILVAAAFSVSAQAADWPQWRGLRRNGQTAETVKPWGAGGPKKLWSFQVGEGFSSVAVAKNRIYTLGNANGQDTLFCLDANTGKETWRYSYRADAGDYGGPRSTPTVDGAVVYTLSRDGIALAVNSQTGKLIWQKDLRKECSAETPQWGFAGSPLVLAGKIIYNVGSSGIALNGAGKVVWKGGNGKSGYASPVLYKMGAQTGVALFSAKSVMGIDPNTGKVLWLHPWNTNYDVNAADPIVEGDTVFVSSNYGRGCALLRIAGGKPSVVWENRNMKNHFNSCVSLNGAFFGNDENTLKCIDKSTGQERWRMRGGLGKGGLIAAGGKLIVLSERGELILADGTPGAYQELARAKVMGGTCWTHPVLANGKIYCRSHEGELVCLAAG